MGLEPKEREETRLRTNRVVEDDKVAGKICSINNIVAQKAGNTTSLFGEFKCQNLPIWQVFEDF